MNEQQIASELLKNQAVKLSPQRSFVWASGIHSPIYCDNRSLLSFPESRRLITEALCSAVEKNYPTAQLIAGVATGAIAWGALVAEQLNLPFIYVRPEKKSHGLGNQIEGRAEAGLRVAVIEDLISTGGSSLKAIKSLRHANIEVLGMTAIFTYQLPQSNKNFYHSNCPLICLSNFHTLIEEAVEKNYISESEAQTIRQWHREQK